MGEMGEITLKVSVPDGMEELLDRAEDLCHWPLTSEEKALSYR
ncbi:hypothetical protein [Thermococcus sp.]|nr:hypothetical protein [Thermococcus sp.]